MPLFHWNTHSLFSNSGPFLETLKPTPSVPQLTPPKPLLFQIRVDVPIENALEEEPPRYIRTPLDVMLLINGCGVDGTSTDLRAMTHPLITKDFWPVLAKSPPNDHILFDFFCG